MADSRRTTITLAWTAPEGVDGYRVEQASDTLDDWTTIAEQITDAGYTVENLECNKTYAFRLTSHGDGETYQGWSDNIALTMATTSSCNSAPTFFGTTHNFPIPEDAPASTIVGIVPATDEDGDTITYSLSRNGDQEPPFAINQTTSEITVQEVLDYETNPEYSLTIEATDSNGTTATTTVTIIVTDAAEAPVFEHDSYKFSVAENAATGHIVGTASADDQDAGDTLTYSIASGNEAGDFVLTTSDSGAQVSVAQALDQDTTATYNLTIQVADATDGTDTTTVVITVTEVAEEPPPERSKSTNQNHLTLPRNAAGGTPASDPQGQLPRTEVHDHRSHRTPQLNEVYPTGTGEGPHPAKVPILTAP